MGLGKPDAAINRIYQLAFKTRLEIWIWNSRYMAVCRHRHRLHQTTCINVVNCKKVTKRCQVFFAESGIGVPSYHNYVIIISHLSCGVKFFFKKMRSEFLGVINPLNPPYQGDLQRRSRESPESGFRSPSYQDIINYTVDCIFCQTFFAIGEFAARYISKSDRAMSGVIPIRICMWSGIELIRMTVCFLLVIMRVIY